MLIHLQIKNYVLIDDLELSLSPGLTIITGETGAGKSILLGAIGLLLGQRAEAKVLSDQAKKCVVEGTFDIAGYDLKDLFESEDLDYSPQTHIRREIAPGGKSRAFVNDTPVNLDLLRRITGQLIDIHSQHDSILLGNGVVQTELLDAFCRNSPVLADYQAAFRKWKDAEDALRDLKEEAAGIRKENDYHHYLWQELDAAKLNEGEVETLEAEQAILENAAEIKSKFIEMSQYFDGSEISALQLLNEIAHQLQYVNRLAPAYQVLAQRLTNAILELKDIAAEIEDTAESVEVNEERIGEVGQRLDLLYLLLKKHQVETPGELVVLRDELRERINKFESLDSDLKRAQDHADTAWKKLATASKNLSETRKKGVPAFEKLIGEISRELGITHAVFKVSLTAAAQPTLTGPDKIEFLFSANKGIAPQPLKNVASGGEFSRLMLAFKYAVAEKKKLATLVFDEIDTGISGEIARKMGEMLKTMGRTHQLIAITHLHQIASFATTHLYVFKDNSRETTVSKIRKFSDEERIGELAQMIGGANPSAAVMANARELLEKSV